MIKELFKERKWKREGNIFYHKQVYFDGNVYIYAVDMDDEEMKHPYYEVFKRKIIPDIKVVEGKFVKSNDNFHVKYPGNEDFGKWARNCSTYEDAMKYVEEWSSEHQK